MRLFGLTFSQTNKSSFAVLVMKVNSQPGCTHCSIINGSINKQLWFLQHSFRQVLGAFRGSQIKSN